MKLSPKAVLLGAVADILSTNVLLIPVIIIVDVQLVHAAPGRAPTTTAVAQAMKGSTGLYLAALILGSLASVFGGWVAARAARHSPVLNGAASAIGCVGFGVYGMIRVPHAAPLWQEIGFFLLSPALGALGGVVERRRTLRPAERPAHGVPDNPVIASPSAAPTAMDARLAAPTQLRGVRRAVYVVNRVLVIVVVLVFLLFVVGAITSYAQHQTEAIVGCSVLCGLMVAAYLLLFAGARSLKGGRNHWVFHAIAVVLLAIPIGALALAFSGRGP